MNSQGTRKAEKSVGYALITVGIILIILPAIVALWFLLTGSAPQLIQVPGSDQGDLFRSAAVFSNVCAIFFIFVVVIWAGSIVSARGVAMVKDVKLRLVRKSLKEAEETASKLE